MEIVIAAHHGRRAAHPKGGGALFQPARTWLKPLTKENTMPIWFKDMNVAIIFAKCQEIEGGHGQVSPANRGLV